MGVGTVGGGGGGGGGVDESWERWKNCKKWGRGKKYHSTSSYQTDVDLIIPDHCNSLALALFSQFLTTASTFKLDPCCGFDCFRMLVCSA